MTAKIQQSNYTPVEEIPHIVSTLQKNFYTGITLPEKYRRIQLEKLYALLTENEAEIVHAIQSDMKGRPTNEILLTELSFSCSEIAHLLNNLNAYMSTKKLSSSAAFLTDKAYLHYSPMGNVLLISPWNFPIHLTIGPLAGIIAAGCTAVIKPSEVSGNVGNLLAKLIPRYLDKNAYKVVLGGVTQTTELLQQRFDLIFFTGSCKVGKIVAKAAAKNLTPVVLELGGKNAVVVDDTCDLSIAAKRIAWGRWCLNCGQVCLSPEYVIINKALQSQFIEELKKTVAEYFGNNPQLSDSYSRIVNANHFQRLQKVLKDNVHNIAFGGESDSKDLYISPTVLSNINSDSSVMDDEVFGPILSIYPVNDVRTDAIPLIQSQPKSLAMYIFTNDGSFADLIVEKTDAGGVTINDVITHATFPEFPFGGIGHSGNGRYHGWYSFAACSHEKPVLNKYSGLEMVNVIRKPPFTDNKMAIYKALTEEKPTKWRKYFQLSPLTVLAVAGGVYFLKSKL